VKPPVNTCEITRDDEETMCEHVDEAVREKTSASKKLAKQKVQFEKTLVNIATIEAVAAALKAKLAPLEETEADTTPVVEKKFEATEDFRRPVVRPLAGQKAASCSGSAQNSTDISTPERITSSTQNQDVKEIDTSSEVAPKRSTEQKSPAETPESDSSSSFSSQISKRVTIGPISTKSMSSDQSMSITTQNSTEASGFQQVKSNKHKKLLRQCTALLASVGVADLAKVNMETISKEDLKPFFQTLSKMCAKPPSQDTPTDSPMEQTERS
jgi:glucan-binding YG repeat protein